MSDEVAEDTGGGGNKTLLVLGLIIGLAVGGGVVYTMLGQNAPPADSDDAAEEEVVEKTIKLEEMDFKKFAVPVYQERRGRQYEAGNYVLDFKVMSKPEHFDYVTSNRLALSQEFLSALNKYNVMKEGTTNVLDYEKAALALLYAGRKVVGEKRIDKVFIIKAERVR